MTDDINDLDCARGIFYALLFSAPFWIWWLT
jgi:hypothetical protein